MRSHILIISFISLLIISCKPEKRWDCTKSKGSLNSQTIALNKSFKTIIIDGYFNLKLIQDSTNKIIFTGGKNLLYKASAYQRNDSLFINNKNTCNWVRSYKSAQLQADLHFTDFNYIKTLRPIDIYTDDTLYFNILTLDIWGGIGSCNLLLNCNEDYLKLNAATGNYHLAGHTNFNYIFSIGSGNIYTDQLVAKKCVVINNSNGNISFWATDNANVEIYNTGNTYYKEYPKSIEVKKTDYATGELLPL